MPGRCQALTRAREVEVDGITAHLPHVIVAIPQTLKGQLTANALWLARV
jgi:folylpolyglutamate synthase/dihydropteroate synthase